jgi:thioredoxin 1
MSIAVLNDQTFRDGIRRQGVTLVDFGTIWCPPCKALLPILHELGHDYQDNLSIVKVDCDESPEAAAQYGIMSMPTVIVLHNGEPVDKLVGLRSKGVYKNVIDRYLTS